MRALLLPLGIAVATAAAAAPAPAAALSESPWADALEGRMRLVGGGGDGPWLGLTFDLRPEWKVFWRSPGAPGLPPVLDWQGSRNLESAQIVWPAPEIFTSFGYRARGFGGRFTLPIRAAVRDADAALEARVLVLFQLCKDVCIPVETRLALNVPASVAAHPDIVTARARVPKPAGSGFSEWRAERRGRRLTVRIRHRNRVFASPVVLVEAPRKVRLGRMVALPPDSAGRFGVSIPILGKRPVPGDLRIRVTLIDGPEAWEKSVPVSVAVDR